MIFAGIDVNIIHHEKAYNAGPEALGLWLWGMCYAQIHETDGRLPRVAVMSAWGAERRVLRRLAVRLVTSGLWVESEDGSFQVHNYRTKNQTADDIRRKKDEARERKRLWKDRQENASGTRSKTIPERDGTLLPPSPSPPLQTPPPPGVPADPPDWFLGVIDTIAMNTGETLEPGTSWLRYAGHRASKDPPKPTSPPDASYWLTTVMVPELREIRRREVRDSERMEVFRRDRNGPEVKPLPSVAPLMREREEWERTAASPEDQAVAAANLQKLLGGVGR